MPRWAVELFEFDVQYEPRGPIKGQVYADFVVELSLATTHQDSGDFQWGWCHLRGTKWVTNRAGPTIRFQG